MRILLTAIFSIVVHLLFGWAWTLGAGILGGALAERTEGARGWFVGAAGVALAWAILVVYNFVVAGTPTQILVDNLGALFGNIPGFVLVGGTVLLGALIGALGGVIGQTLATLTGSDVAEPTPS